MAEQGALEAAVDKLADDLTSGMAPEAQAGKASRSAMVQFLDSGIALMTSKPTRALLKAEAHPGQKLIELQRSGWDPLGIDRDLGCSQLDALERDLPDDAELHKKRQEFVLTAQRAFLQALEDKKPKKLETKKPIPRATLILFFDACNTKMDLPELKQALMAHAEKTRQMPNNLIINAQRHMLEVMGFEKEHGCRMLSNVGKDFPNDTEIHRRFTGWKQKAQMTCVQAMQAVGIQVVAMPQMPQNPFGDEESEEIKQLRARAEEEVGGMSPGDRGALVQKMTKKLETLSKLPEEARFNYVKKLPEAEKLEMIKVQIITMSMLQQQQGSGGGYSGAGQQERMESGGHPVAAPATVSTPVQQEMM